jgi:hypothetical protein
MIKDIIRGAVKISTCVNSKEDLIEILKAIFDRVEELESENLELKEEIARTETLYINKIDENENLRKQLKKIS